MKDLKEALNQQRHDEHFDAVVDWVEAQNNASERPFFSRLMDSNGRIINMIRYFQSHKIRTALATAFLALFIVACNMPMQHTETVGYVVTYSMEGSVEDPTYMIPEALMFDASEANTWVSVEDDVTLTRASIVIPDITVENLAELEAALESTPAIIEYNFTTINETSTIPAYDAAFRHIFHINLSGNTMDTDELAEQIRAQLQAQGVEPSVIEVIVNDDNSLQFNFQFDHTGSESGEYEMAIFIDDPEGADSVDVTVGASHDGNGNDVNGAHNSFQFKSNGDSMEFIDIQDLDIEGKTPAEIEKLILDKLKANGADENINIKVLDAGDDVQLKMDIQD